MSQNLGTTTLGGMMANVRAQSKTLSSQESNVLDIQLADFIQDAIIWVRGVYGKSVDEWYRTRYTALIFSGSTPNFTVDISSLSISDISRLRIYDATALGEIPIVSNAEFNGFRSNYTAAQIGTTKGIATIAAAGGTMASKAANPPITILLYSNAAAAPQTPELFIIRNPIKVLFSAPTDTLDAPEHIMPLVQDAATVYVLNKMGQPIPENFQNKITQQVTSALQQLNLNIIPNAKQA